MRVKSNPTRKYTYNNGPRLWHRPYVPWKMTDTMYSKHMRELYPRRDWLLGARRYAIKDLRYQHHQKYKAMLAREKADRALFHAEEAANLALANLGLGRRGRKRKVTWRDTVDSQQRYFSRKKPRFSRGGKRKRT